LVKYSAARGTLCLTLSPLPFQELTTP